MIMALTGNRLGRPCCMAHDFFWLNAFLLVLTSASAVTLKQSCKLVAKANGNTSIDSRLCMSMIKVLSTANIMIYV